MTCPAGQTRGTRCTGCVCMQKTCVSCLKVRDLGEFDLFEKGGITLIEDNRTCHSCMKGNKGELQCTE